MNSAKKPKKKISEYKIEDLKEIFSDFLKKISSKIILIEITNESLNIGLAKSQNNKLHIKKVFRQSLPEEALDKSLPNDPVNFGNFLKQVIDENKINTNRVALSLPSDACYTRLIDIPEEVDKKDAINFLDDPSSDIQIPISLGNSDFEINLTNLPKQKIKNKIFNKYFLTSIPKKNVDIILESIKNANLEICSIQMSHICIANLLKKEIDILKEDDLIISVDLLDEFTQFVIFDSSGPLCIKRLASIRNYPSIEDMKKINVSNSKNNKNSNIQTKAENYHPLSKLDLKVLLREINQSFTSFINENNLEKKGKIFLSGRNSQHKNLVELIGKGLKIDVALISPINHSYLNEFSYNPDVINQFSMSRIIGLGLTLIKNNDSEYESTNRGLIAQDFVFQEDKKEVIEENSNNIESKTVVNLMDSLNKLNEGNKIIKQTLNQKTKSEEKKKELPPLPNLKIKDRSGNISEGPTDNEDKIKKQKVEKDNKKNKSFKMDTSFLKND